MMGYCQSIMRHFGLTPFYQRLLPSLKLISSSIKKVDHYLEASGEVLSHYGIQSTFISAHIPNVKGKVSYRLDPCGQTRMMGK